MPRKTFPTIRDLAGMNISREELRDMLAVLREAADKQLIDLYSAAGSHDTRWNIWFSDAALPCSPTGEQRVELREFARDFAAHHTA